VPKITSTSSKRYIGIGSLQERYDCSHMFIERLLKKDPTFPRPVKLAPGKMAHRMWDEDALAAWERSRIARSA
jgi:predicted DNA-binding transcriptional regulator AlpA